MSEINLDYAQSIGKRLRAIRLEKKMSLRTLAIKAKMSASMLSQVETGKSFPSVHSIYSIAAALGVPVDSFFPDQAEDDSPALPETKMDSDDLTASEMREVQIERAINGGTKRPRRKRAVDSVVHANARPTIDLKGGVTWARLTTFAEPDAEFLEITYAPGASSGNSMSHHEGREFGFVLEGELVVELGFEQYTLCCGDSIIFDSTQPHRLSNRTEKPVRALWVVLN